VNYLVENFYLNTVRISVPITFAWCDRSLLCKQSVTSTSGHGIMTIIVLLVSPYFRYSSELVYHSRPLGRHAFLKAMLTSATHCQVFALIEINKCEPKHLEMGIINTHCIITFWKLQRKKRSSNFSVRAVFKNIFAVGVIRVWSLVLFCLLYSRHTWRERNSTFRIIFIVLFIVSECPNHARYSGTMGFGLASMKRKREKIRDRRSWNKD
jgi:hypothetical protein